MKRCTFVFLIFFAIIYSVYSQDTLKPRIAVFPLMNPTEDVQVEIISENVRKTAELTLKMIDRYEVVETDVKKYDGNSEWFSSYSVENSIDSIIFGKADMREDGSILLEMSAYSRGDNSVTMTENETAETVFDIFDASDRLLVSMMESFSGMEHIGFGSVQIINKGEKGKYSVYIDNVPVEDNTEELPKILNGERILRIEQNRMLGPYIVKEESFFLNENEKKVLEFSIPGLTDAELLEITPLENYIDKNWENKYSSKKIDKNFEKLEELFAVTGYSTSADGKKNAVLEKKKEWQLQKQNWGIEKGLSILDKKLGIAGFGGANMSIPGFTAVDSAEQKNEVGKKYGVSVSYNILNYIALQAEYNFTEYRAKIERETTIDTYTIELNEIPVMLLFRMPNKVMSAYAGISFLNKIGDMDIEIEDIATGDIITMQESNDEMVKTDGRALIFGALFEIPINRSFLMFDFRYTSGFDDWARNTDEEIIPKYFSMAIGYGFKFF